MANLSFTWLENKKNNKREIIMNYNELKQLTKQCQAIGIITMADLRWFKKMHRCKTNNDLLNAVNDIFCMEVK